MDGGIGKSTISTFSRSVIVGVTASRRSTTTFTSPAVCRERKAEMPETADANWLVSSRRSRPLPRVAPRRAITMRASLG